MLRQGLLRLGRRKRLRLRLLRPYTDAVGRGGALGGGADGVGQCGGRGRGVLGGAVTRVVHVVRDVLRVLRALVAALLVGRGAGLGDARDFERGVLAHLGLE